MSYIIVTTAQQEKRRKGEKERDLTSLFRKKKRGGNICIWPWCVYIQTKTRHNTCTIIYISLHSCAAGHPTSLSCTISLAYHLQQRTPIPSSSHNPVGGWYLLGLAIFLFRHLTHKLRMRTKNFSAYETGTYLLDERNAAMWTSLFLQCKCLKRSSKRFASCGKTRSGNW